jgi:hypothetical protein
MIAIPAEVDGIPLGRQAGRQFADRREKMGQREHCPCPPGDRILRMSVCKERIDLPLVEGRRMAQIPQRPA